MQANIEKLRAALAAARAKLRGISLSGEGAMLRVKAAVDASISLERELADAEGVEVAYSCPWDVPWSSGAPCPVVFSDGFTTHVAYFASEESPANLVVLSPGQIVGIASFRGCRAHRFGPPNDEAIEGHPLYGRGLEMYGAHLVGRSSWIDELERRNRVHRWHKPEAYTALKHYLLCFHDQTFECVAEGHSFEVVEGEGTQSVLFQRLASAGTTGRLSEVSDGDPRVERHQGQDSASPSGSARRGSPRRHPRA